MSQIACHELGYDLQEALDRCNIQEKDLHALKNPPIPGVPANITDKQLLLFLNACGDVAQARQCLETYYDSRRNAPEHFTNRDPRSDEILQCFQAQEYILLPPTAEGHDVIFHRLYQTAPSAYNYDQAIRTFFMTIDMCLYSRGPRPGLVFLFDMKGVSLGHLTRLRVAGTRKFFKYLQDALPAKLKAIHVMNVVPFFDKILLLIKPFMKKELMNMLHIHSSNIDMEKFYAEILPRSVLPSDFGGDLADCRTLHQEFCEKIQAHASYFVAEEQQRYNGIQTNGKKKQVTSEAEFRRLEID
uniref:Putative phosphatidylinositol transfer protein sec14 n=1 Tax=Xenopsylla cheopis TaxID=163159 RepID=A0A6M2DE55_XENCH